MATIEAYETSAGKRYRVRYRTPDRKQTSKSGFRTVRDAKLFGASVEVDKATGEFIEAAAGKATVGALGQAWLAGRAHLKPGSRVAYESNWRNHVEPEWGTRSVMSIMPSEVQAWVSALSAKRSPDTVRRSVNILAGVLESAVADRRIPRNPARSLKLPRKLKRKRTYLTHEQVKALADAAGGNAPIILTLAYTGIRWGELAGLHVEDVNLANRRLSIRKTASLVGAYVEVGTPKTYEQRSVPFPPFLTETLRLQIDGRAGDSILFPAVEGGYRRSPTNAKTSWFARSKKRASMPEEMTIHDLRRTYASLAISAGASVKALQHALGHSSAVQTLDTYSDLFQDDLDAVALALDSAHQK